MKSRPSTYGFLGDFFLSWFNLEQILVDESVIQCHVYEVNTELVRSTNDMYSMLGRVMIQQLCNKLKNGVVLVIKCDVIKQTK